MRTVGETYLDIVTMGPFESPLTPAQRRAMDGFIRMALDLAIPFDHEKAKTHECAVAVIPSRRV